MKQKELGSSELYHQLSPLIQKQIQEVTKSLLRRFDPEEAVKLLDWYINFMDAHKECL